MNRARALLMAAVVACSADPSIDTGEAAELPCWERVGGSCGDSGDTGTAWLVWHGDFTITDGTLTASRGLAAKNIASGEYVCDIAAGFEGTEASPDPCPDCTFSYSLTPTGGGTTGTHCESWVRSSTIFDQAQYYDFYFGRAMDGFGFAQTYAYNSGTYSFTLESVVFADYTATDFWWSDGTIRDGWGWSDAYIFTGSDGTEYDLENVMFDHITYDGYNGWYFRAYNFPAGGVTHVVGDSYRSDWEAPAYSEAGARMYYYFYC